MNRAQRRASQFKRAQQYDRNRLVEPSHVLRPVARSRGFDADEAATFSVEVRQAWHHLTHGNGTTDHFDTLANAINVCLVRAEDIAGGEVAVEVALRAQAALADIKRRYLRLGRFGADAQALQDMPYALDLYDQLLANSSPLQMTQALHESLRRMQCGEVLEIAP